MKRILRAAIGGLGGAAAVLAIACAPAQAAFPGTFAPANPYTAANGAATMHADSESSDASPYPGPGTGAQRVQVNELGAACPTILQGSDGMPVALCTAILGQAPTVYLLDPASGSPLASLKLPTGNLFGGVYAYLDPQNRLVVFDADGNLDRVAHSYSAGHWTLAITSATSISAALAPRCPSLCGGVVGLSPGWHGRVWFATARGVGGFVDPATGAVKTIALGSGEQVANSISTAPQGTAIATDHALYLLTTTATGEPKIVWRYPYDRGSARKPGQLSQGTGSTPTFFGPQDGTRYLAITDNASPAEHLIVIDTKATSATHPTARTHKPKQSKKKEEEEAGSRDGRRPDDAARRLHDPRPHPRARPAPRTTRSASAAACSSPAPTAIPIRPRPPARPRPSPRRRRSPAASPAWTSTPAAAAAGSCGRTRCARPPCRASMCPTASCTRSSAPIRSRPTGRATPTSTARSRSTPPPARSSARRRSAPATSRTRCSSPPRSSRAASCTRARSAASIASRRAPPARAAARAARARATSAVTRAVTGPAVRLCYC